jgi:hypothetical protein
LSKALFEIKPRPVLARLGRFYTNAMRAICGAATSVSAFEAHPNIGGTNVAQHGRPANASSASDWLLVELLARWESIGDIESEEL